MRLAVGLALALAVWTRAAVAQEDPVAAARAAGEALATAAATLATADDAQDRIAALTATVQSYDEGLGLMREALRRVTEARSTREARLAARTAETAALLTVLQRIDPAEAPLLLLHPSGALGAARSGLMLAGMMPVIEAEAATVAEELAALASLAATQEAGMAQLAEGQAAVEQARDSLARAARQRGDLPRRFEEDAVAMAHLTASAVTLDALAEGLDATVEGEPVAAGTGPLVPDGTIAPPVQGRVIGRPGEADAAGVVRPGVVFATRPRAIVTTPVVATVRFRGPILGNGEVIILEPAPEVLFVLAGLGEVWPRVGEVLPAGTPIGLMGGGDPSDGMNSPDAAFQGAEPLRETLYLEVRDADGPANPADWFALAQ